MNTLNNQSNRIAGFVAILATVVICGGTLALADRYAHSGSVGQEYLAATHQTAAAVLKRAS